MLPYRAGPGVDRRSHAGGREDEAVHAGNFTSRPTREALFVTLVQYLTQKCAKICPGTCHAPSRLRALRVRLYCPRTENSRRSARRTRRLVLGTCNAPPRPTREARTPSVLKTPALPRRLRAGCVDSTCPKAAGGFAVLFTPGHRHPHLVPPLRGRTAAGSRQTPGSCRR